METNLGSLAAVSNRGNDEPGASVEVVDGELVGDTPRPGPGADLADGPRSSSVVAAVRAMPVSAQAAAVAVTGFAAGAMATAVVRRATGRRTLRAAPRKGAKGLPIRGTRSFLVDVHLLDHD